MLSPGTQQAETQKLNMNPNPLILAIPASFDFCASTLMFIALTMVPASVYQMTRGFLNVVCPFLSIIFLKRKQYIHHWIGVISIVIGVAEVGWVALTYDASDEDTTGSIALGLILIIVAQFFAGAMFVTEEHLLGGYYLDPMKVVGSEGMWGLGIYLALLPIMQVIHCTGSDGLSALCNFNYLENSSYAFAQMG